MEGSIMCSANYVPLTPISFLERSAIVYGDRLSIVFGDVTYTWAQTHQRCIKLASSIFQLLASFPCGQVVAALAPNVPAMYELHFGVPMSGAILCSMNTSLDSEMVSFMLKDSNAKIFFVDHEFLEVAQGALQLLANSSSTTNIPLLVLILEDGQTSLVVPQTLTYENLIENGNLNFEIKKPNNELDPISISYTSGTTSTPKGVIYSHRGAYLNALSTILLSEMRHMPIYLWSVPMFHCNGWCLPWGIAAQGGTNICQRNVTAKGIFDSIVKYKVTHMGGAPTILNIIVNATEEERKPLPHKVEVMTGGATPPPQVLFKIEEMGFNVTHAYGMTEVYGAGSICSVQPEWDSLPRDARAKLKSRQGVRHLGMDTLDVKDPATMESIPADGKSVGEVMFRGNTVMSGYLNKPKDTQKAFQGGWFRTGDMGIKHPDGYLEVKDRSQDIIISGGKHISTIELDGVIYSHPAVLEVAVVGKPDNYLGETPCAFVKLKDECSVTPEEIIQFCRDRLPSYMAPTSVVFGDLPKTSTGKTKKYVLREKAKAIFS